MQTRLISLWIDVRTSYWFLPLLMAIAIITLSFITIDIDHRLDLGTQRSLADEFVTSPSGARAVLSTIAASTITVGGVVFSILVAALANASSQFGPRILRTFMGDLGSQLSLGTFISTFIYCLLVLRSVHSGEDGISFIPVISIAVAIMLALASSGVLIYFLHHSAGLINVTNVQARLGHEMLEALEYHYPNDVQPGARQRRTQREAVPLNQLGRSVLPDGRYRIIEAQRAGYVEAIDQEAIIDLARANDIVVRVVRPPGDFAIPGAALAHVWPEQRATDQLAAVINSAFILGPRRTTIQEVAIYFDELTEIALRALSPAINDPYTAITSIDWATAGLSTLGRRQALPRYVYDQYGDLRLISNRVRFEEMVGVVFDQIRDVAASYPQVLLALLEAIIAIAPCARTEDQRQALRRQATAINQLTRSQDFMAHQTAKLRDAYRAAIGSLDAGRSTVED